MLNIDDVLAIKRIALQNVQQSTLDRLLERAYRHYSKTYFTPLQDAYKLPESDILLLYFEDIYSELEEHQLEDEKNTMYETDHKIVYTGIKPVEESVLTDDQWIAQQIERMKKKDKPAVSNIDKTVKALEHSLGELAKITGKDTKEQETVTFEDID